MRTRWRRLLDVDDAEHLCGVAELFNLDGAQINSSPSKVRSLCERLPTEPNIQRLLPLQLRTTVKSRALVAGWLGCGSVTSPPGFRIRFNGLAAPAGRWRRARSL